MARLRRYCPPGIPVHVIQRGNNRSDCFAGDQDKATYIHFLREAAERYEASLHAWVLMSNHIHLLLTPTRSNAVSRLMQHLGSRYVAFFNRKHSRTGTLWEGRFRGCLVQAERYFLNCHKYIELNPVRAGMVDEPGDYHWSSYHSNALGVKISVCKPHSVYLALGKTENSRRAAYRELFHEALSESEIEKIRQSVNKGIILGSAEFVRLVEAQSGQRGHPLKRGPKKSA